MVCHVESMDLIMVHVRNMRRAAIKKLQVLLESLESNYTDTVAINWNDNYEAFHRLDKAATNASQAHALLVEIEGLMGDQLDQLKVSRDEYSVTSQI